MSSRCVFIAFLLTLAFSVPVCSSLAEAGTLPLTFHEFPAERAVWGDANLVPLPGAVVVIVRLNHSSFAVEDINHITVIPPSGNTAELTFETSSIVEEFGEIISVRFAFVANPSELASDGRKIAWGEDAVEGTQTPVIVESFALSADRASDYREGRFDAQTGPRGDASATEIEIIADSSADYYSLWYLLPMAVIISVLTARKLRARQVPNV